MAVHFCVYMCICSISRGALFCCDYSPPSMPPSYLTTSQWFWTFQRFCSMEQPHIWLLFEHLRLLIAANGECVCGAMACHKSVACIQIFCVRWWACMCVYVYVYVCVWMYTCVKYWEGMHVRILVWAWSGVCVCVCVCVYTRECILVCFNVFNIWVSPLRSQHAVLY